MTQQDFRFIPLSGANFDHIFYSNFILNQIENETKEKWLMVSFPYEYRGRFEVGYDKYPDYLNVKKMEKLENESDINKTFLIYDEDSQKFIPQEFVIKFGKVKLDSIDVTFGPVAFLTFSTPDVFNEWFFILEKDKEQIEKYYGQVLGSKKEYINTEIFPKEANKLVSIIKNTFSLEKEKVFAERRLPCQLGVMLSGLPGCGKSMFVNHLTQMAASFENPRLRTHYVYSAAAALQSAQEGRPIPSQGIIIFDDIESIIKERESDEADGTSGMVLSWMLNGLDGGSKDVFRVIILVTNHRKVIDDALLRPGRIDMHVKFNPPKMEYLKKLLMFHTQNDISEELATEVAKELKEKFKKNGGATFAHVSFLCRLAYTSTMIDQDGKDLKLTNIDFWKNIINSMKEFSPYRGSKVNENDESVKPAFGFGAFGQDENLGEE